MWSADKELLDGRDWIFFSLLALPITALGTGSLEVFGKQMNVKQTNAASCRPGKCAEGHTSLTNL